MGKQRKVLLIAFGVFVALMAGDGLLWYGAGRTAQVQVQAALITAASVLPVAVIGVIGTVLGAWSTHWGAMERDRLVRLQSEKLAECARVIAFVQEYAQAKKDVDAAHELRTMPLDPHLEKAYSDALDREQRLRHEYLLARNTLAILIGDSAALAKLDALAAAVKDGRDTLRDRQRFIDAIRDDLQIAV